MEIFVYTLIILVCVAGALICYKDYSFKKDQKRIIKEIYPEVIKSCLSYAKKNCSPEEYSKFIIEFEQRLSYGDKENLAVILNECISKAKENVEKDRQQN